MNGAQQHQEQTYICYYKLQSFSFLENCVPVDHGTRNLGNCHKTKICRDQIATLILNDPMISIILDVLLDPASFVYHAWRFTTQNFQKMSRAELFCIFHRDPIGDFDGPLFIVIVITLMQMGRFKNYSETYDSRIQISLPELLCIFHNDTFILSRVSLLVVLLNVSL